MPLSRTNNFVNNTPANAVPVQAEFDLVYSGINAHVAAATLDHPDASVTTSKLALLSVTTSVLAADAVTNAKLADDAVQAENIATGAVGVTELAALAVTIPACAAGVGGWHGALTRIKIMPGDFVSNDGTTATHSTFQAAGFSANKTGSNSVNACIPIPTGYKATAARVYGHTDLAAMAVVVYECNIADNTCTSKGTGNPAGEIDITDVASTSTNFLMVTVEAPNNKLIYGGYITIAAI
jgi:hypothetical protein